MSALVLIAALASASPDPVAYDHAPQASCAQPSSLLPSARERRAILGALRPVVERELGGPIEFVVTQIRVVGPHAFVIVTPRRPGGVAIRPANDQMDGVRTEAIFVKQNGRWHVTKHGIGTTDVWYAGEIDNYPFNLIPAC